MIPMPQYRTLIASMERALDAVCKERTQHPGMVGGSPAWEVRERAAMLQAVNFERQRLGKAPIPLEEVIRVDQLATGHVDWQHKFALYCADLVVDVP